MTIIDYLLKNWFVENDLLNNDPKKYENLTENDYWFTGK